MARVTTPASRPRSRLASGAENGSKTYGFAIAGHFVSIVELLAQRRCPIWCSS
jgi:hypothetical protein